MSDDDRIMSTTKARPILFARHGTRCTDCRIGLAHPSIPETVIPFPLPDDPKCCFALPGLRWAEVDHVIPRSAGGPSCLSNYELVRGPCNLARFQQWKARCKG